ncbi:MAG: DUF2336 domain-containing protein [Rickettsiales bacterium]
MSRSLSVESIEIVGEVPYPRLTQKDVWRLLNDPTIETKIDILEKVAHQFDPEKLGDTEMKLAEQIFRLLMRDSAIRIRRSLSESLAGNPSLPRDVARALAFDLESVATPVLRLSHVLTQDDLMEIIENSEEIWRYLAIAQRENLPSPISDALIETKQIPVYQALLENQTAEIKDQALGKIADHAGNRKEIAEGLAKRPKLPLKVVEKILHAVSEDVRIHLQNTYIIDHEILESETRHAREEHTVDLIFPLQPRDETERLVASLHTEGRLTASLVINALCYGNVDFFIASMAAMANIPLDNARMLINDRGKLGFRALYNKTHLPGSMYKATRLLLDSVRTVLDSGIAPGGLSFGNHVVREMLQHAEKEKIENLPYMLAIIRQRPNR